MKFSIEWVEGARNASEVERATMCRLRIVVGETNACVHLDQQTGETRDYVVVPVVHLAEGIATDWWKIFGGRDAPKSIWNYRTGFILPCLTLRCYGSIVEVSGEQMRCTNPGLRFWQAGSEVISRKAAETECAEFVTSVVDRLETKNIHGTEVQLRWEAVLQSRQNQEESDFCEAVGALGVDPYLVDDRQADFVLHAASIFSGDALSDFLAGVKPQSQDRREAALSTVLQAHNQIG